jgi:hypothetical protein
MVKNSPVGNADDDLVVIKAKFAVSRIKRMARLLYRLVNRPKMTRNGFALIRVESDVRGLPNSGDERLRYVSPDQQASFAFCYLGFTLYPLYGTAKLFGFDPDHGKINSLWDKSFPYLSAAGIFILICAFWRYMDLQTDLSIQFFDQKESDKNQC